MFVSKNCHFKAKQNSFIKEKNIAPRLLVIQVNSVTCIWQLIEGTCTVIQVKLSATFYITCILLCRIFNFPEGECGIRQDIPVGFKAMIIANVYNAKHVISYMACFHMQVSSMDCNAYGVHWGLIYHIFFKSMYWFTDGFLFVLIIEDSGVGGKWLHDYFPLLIICFHVVPHKL